MKKLTDGILKFISKQPYTVLTTVDKKGYPHSSCKAVVYIDENKHLYLLDLYRRNTYENLKVNSNVSITAVDEHKFAGYCLKGKAEITRLEKLDKKVFKAWEEKINKRISKRLLKNLKGEKGHPRHPEARLPDPKYFIMVKVREVIDLTPGHINE